ncbi:hypothetical protein [Kitasatospora cineracea]|uniref:hypothetical protein n=1 Tax=Kitasatospora cineracea TaxID=88074 RepID=UPI0013C2CB37|nr:hypothetical protein [Kitasatospora cineracea]
MLIELLGLPGGPYPQYGELAGQQRSQMASAAPVAVPRWTQPRLSYLVATALG